MATCKKRKILAQFGRVVIELCERTDRRTNKQTNKDFRHTHRNTSHPSRGPSNNNRRRQL